MKKSLIAFIPVCLLVILSGCASDSRANEAPDTVSAVELQRYTGLWYQVARYPHFFQRKECRFSTAKYTLLDDGRIEVRNDCWADEVGGKRRQTVRAFARPIDATNAWLKVRFYRLFDADYLIIELDEEYRWAVVTTPDMDTLWILCREPSLEEDIYLKVLDRLEKRGFIREDIIRTSLQ
jgi:apolipoprotein D and lipocalin family protein